MNTRHFLRPGLTLGCALLMVCRSPADPPAPQLGIEAHPGEGGTAVRLTAPSGFPAGTTFESVDTLASPTLWEFVEELQGAGETGAWEDPRVAGDRRFYRVRNPEPEIARVEPAFGTGEPGELVHLVGQCFDDTDTVEVNGEVLAVTFLDAGLVSVALPALPPGRHTFVLRKADGRTFEFPHVFDTRSASRAFGPPTCPPARPYRLGQDGQTSQVIVRGWDYRTKRAPGTGEVQVDVGGFLIPGRGFDFVWSLHYRSRSTGASALGPRWDFSYNVKLVELPNGNLEIWDGGGVGRELDLQPDGSFAADELFFRVADIDQDGRPDLVFPDHGRWIFHPFDGSAPAGRLVEARDRFNNAMLFSYDPAGRLARVTDTLGREIELGYTPAGQLASVTDFTGRELAFSYYQPAEAGGNPGDLKSIRSPLVVGTPNGNDFPQGKTLTFRYTSGQADDAANHLLTTIIDGRGQTAREWVYQLNQTDYAFLRCVAERRGITINTTHVEYRQVTPAPGNGFATTRTIINDQVGNVQEWFTDSLNRTVMLREFTGSADPNAPTTESANRPANKLRANDPDYFETRWEWTRDSLLRGITYPRGNGVLLTYARDVAPNADSLVKGNPLSLRHNNPLYSGNSQAGQNPLNEPKQSVMLFSHLPGYGSPGELEFATEIIDPNGHATHIGRNSLGQMTQRSTGGGAAVHDYTWDDFGRLTAYTHPANSTGHRRVDTWTYEESPQSPQFGYLRQSVIDDAPAGHRLTTGYEHDELGRLRRRIDPRGHDELTTWNELDQVVQARSAALPTGNVGEVYRIGRTFAYDASNNLVSDTTEDRDDTGTLSPDTAFVTRYEYDSLDRCTAVVREQSGTALIREETDYDGEHRVIEERTGEATNGNDPDARTQFVYDERGRLFRQIRAPGSPLQATDQFDYDENGNLRREIQGIEDTTEPRVTRYGFDGLDRLNAVTNALGNVTWWNRDPAGNVLVEWRYGELSDTANTGTKNVRLAESRFAYDSLQRLIRRDDAFFDAATQAPHDDGWRTTSWGFAPNSQVVSGSDDRGRVTTFQYDTANRLASVTDARGNLVVHTYDPNGNRLGSTSTESSDLGIAPKQFAVSSSYDALNRPVTESDGAGNTSQFSYNSRGLLVSRLDAAGALTRLAYDAADRLRRADFYDDAQRTTLLNSTRSGFDANHRLASLIDGNGYQTRYTYDALDRPTATLFADGSVRSWLYDVHGNVIEETQPTGTEVQSTYDRLNRLTGRIVLPGEDVATTTTTETYFHDGLDRVIHAENDTATVTFTRDSLDHVRTEQRGDFVTTATFDALGNRTSVNYPGGDRVNYLFDALNRPTNISYALPGQAPQPVQTRQYEGPDRLVRVLLGNGLNTRFFHSGAAGTTNPDGDQGFRTVNFIRHSASGNTRKIFDMTLTHDAAMNRTSAGPTGGVIPGGAVLSSALGYDQLHRFTRGTKSRDATVLSDTTFVLDAVGNRRTVIGGPHPGSYTMDAATPEPADAQVHQYSGTPLGEQTFDRNGNVRDRRNSLAQTTQRYDYRDQLVEVSDPATGAVLKQYAYDALGRRIRETQPDPGGGDALVREFTYSERQQLEDRSPDGSVRRFLYDGRGDPDADDDQVPTTAERGLIGYVLTDTVLHLHQDDLGTVFAVSDGAGDAIESYDYDEFGRVTIMAPDGSPRPASTVGNDRFFRSLVFDPTTRLYHVGPVRWMAPESMRSQQYSAAEGRFTSRMGTADAPGRADSQYQFAGGNPWSPAGALNSPLGQLEGLLKKEEGGRHTPFHNRFSTGLAHLHKKALIHRDLATRRWGPAGDLDGDGRPELAVLFNPREYTVTKAQDHNSSRSNKSSRAQDHNSSRSNKTASVLDDGGPTGLFLAQKSRHDAVMATIQNTRREAAGGRHEAAMNSIRNLKALHGGGGGGGLCGTTSHFLFAPDPNGTDLSGVTVHAGPTGLAAGRPLAAGAYAAGDHVGFGGAPSVHTAAHEAAHVVQQRGGRP